jgi:hypothetical protein
MIRKENMPALVYCGLWGIRTRVVAMGFLIASLVLTLVIVPFAIGAEYYIFCFFVLVPAWYWYSIKWVDRNSTWS